MPGERKENPDSSVSHPEKLKSNLLSLVVK